MRTRNYLPMMSPWGALRAAKWRSEKKAWRPVWWMRRKRRMRKPPALKRALLRAVKISRWGKLFDPECPF